MEVRPLLVGKEQVRFPDGIQHGRVQVQRVVRVLVVGQPGVVPLLPQEDVDPIVLQPGDKEVGSALGRPSAFSQGAPKLLRRRSVVATHVGVRQGVCASGKNLNEAWAVGRVSYPGTFSNCPFNYIQL